MPGGCGNIIYHYLLEGAWQGIEKEGSKLFQNEKQYEVKEQTWGCGKKVTRKWKCIIALAESLQACKVAKECKRITCVKWFHNRAVKEESKKFRKTVTSRQHYTIGRKVTYIVMQRHKQNMIFLEK